MLALTAGICFFCAIFCGFSAPVPKGVKINGLEVGGLPKQEAAEVVRADFVSKLKDKSLTIYGKTRNYTFKYPEISFRDNVQKVVRGAKKGGSYCAKFECYLCGLNEIAPRICLNESVFMKNPSATFCKSGAPFLYDEGCDGQIVDEEALKADVARSLQGDFSPVELRYNTEARTKSLEEVRAETKLISTFTTYFDGDNATRTNNICLAAEKLNGSILAGGGVLSFNSTVGARTIERGFKSAKIIENGEFVEGVGGGVCQVSTTLYNAALLAGLDIEEYHPHSLAVSYVPPSRDAMVSGSACDLKIKNGGARTVYIRAEAGKGFVRFKIYGKSDGASYSLSSEVVGALPAEVEETTDIAAAREGKDGVKSVGYLLVTRGGKTVKKQLRRDSYAPIKRIVFVGGDGSGEGGENPSENQSGTPLN